MTTTTLFLCGGNGAEARFVAGLLDSSACGEGDAVFLFGDLFRPDRAALVFREPRQILHGDRVVDQHLDRSGAAKLLQRIHCFDHRQRAGVADGIDPDHKTVLLKKVLRFHDSRLVPVRQVFPGVIFIHVFLYNIQISVYTGLLMHSVVLF